MQVKKEKSRFDILYMSMCVLCVLLSCIYFCCANIALCCVTKQLKNILLLKNIIKKETNLSLKKSEI